MIERLVEIREQSGLTQAEFAEKMGVSLTTQKSYERGTSAPNADYMQKLAEAGFDAVYLFTGRRDIQTLSKNETDLLTAFREASIDKQYLAYMTLKNQLKPKDAEFDFEERLKAQNQAVAHYQSTVKPHEEKGSAKAKTDKAPKKGNIITNGLKDLGGAMKRTITRFDNFQVQRRAKFSPVQLAIAKTIDKHYWKLVFSITALTMVVYGIYVATGKVVFGDDTVAYHVIIPWECYISIVVFVAIFEKCNGYPLWNGVKKWWRGE